jgi:hypothetical protein
MQRESGTAALLQQLLMAGPVARNCRLPNNAHRNGRPSVDVGLVVLRVFHAHCVVVEAFPLQDTDERGTEIGQPGRLRVDALPLCVDRNRAATTDTPMSRCTGSRPPSTTWKALAKSAALPSAT